MAGNLADASWSLTSLQGDARKAWRAGNSTAQIEASVGDRVIDAEGISETDTTAIQQVDELLDDLDGAVIEVSFARFRQPVRNMLERSGLMDRVGEERVLLEVDDAVDHTITMGD